MAQGPQAGLGEIEADDLAAALDGYLPFHAAHADLLRRADRPAEAGAAYARARELAATPAERQYLDERLAELAAAERAHRQGHEDGE
jgi:RNA polymerase sigma-70 factor (ECF subfamily)